MTQDEYEKKLKNLYDIYYHANFTTYLELKNILDTVPIKEKRIENNK